MKTPLARRLWTAFRRLPVVAAAGAVLLVALLLVVAPGRAPLIGSLLPVDEAAAELMARPDFAAARLRWMMTPDGRLYRLDLRPDADGRAAALAGFTVELLDGDQRSAAEAAANGELLVDAPDANGLRQSAGRSSSPRRDAPVAPLEAAFFGAAPSADPALEQAPLVFWFMIASPLDPANGRPGTWPAALGLPDRLGRIVRATPAAAHCLLVEGPAADELRAAIAGRRAGDHLADGLGREWSVAARPLLPGEGDPCADPAYLDGPATRAVVRIVDCPEGTPEDTVVHTSCLARPLAGVRVDIALAVEPAVVLASAESDAEGMVALPMEYGVDYVLIPRPASGLVSVPTMMSATAGLVDFDFGVVPIYPFLP